MPKIELSIVLPGYNEAAIIQENLMKVNEVCQELNVPFEIIFINDGSTDKTKDKVTPLLKKIDSLKLISYDMNRGRGYALRQGFSQVNGKYILTIESDMNYGANVISELYNAIQINQFDIIVASPYMKGGKCKNVPINRLSLSKLGNKILSVAMGSIVHTVSGMTRIYRSDCIKSLPLVSDDKEIHLEILSKALVFGFIVSEIPATLSWPDRKMKKINKRKTSFKAKKYINSHLLFTFLQKPLLLFGVFGLIILIFGFILGVYIVYLRYSGGLNPIRPLMTVLVLLLIGGSLMISFGLIGMQINDLRKEIYRIQTKLRDR